MMAFRTPLITNMTIASGYDKPVPIGFSARVSC